MKEDILDALRREEEHALTPSQSDVLLEAIAEIERLREIEWMYRDLCK